LSQKNLFLGQKVRKSWGKVGEKFGKSSGKVREKFGKSLESLETGFSECSEILEILEISEIVLFQNFQKLRKNDVKLELRKLQKTRSESKTDPKVQLKVWNAGPCIQRSKN